MTVNGSPLYAGDEDATHTNVLRVSVNSNAGTPTLAVTFPSGFDAQALALAALNFGPSRTGWPSSARCSAAGSTP